MDMALVCIFVGAIAVLLLGTRLMYSGRHHQVRRNRRADDRRPA
jgi:hypothetical protein